MAHLAITVEGGLISSDLIEQIAATPQDVPGQRPADFGLDGRLSDEIQKAFSEALIHWNAFQARLARGKESPTTITRETWMLPLLEELGFTLTFQRAAAVVGGNTFAISHRLGTDPNAPPVHIVASDQQLDRKGDAQRSPHALVQDYLNRSDALWGVVTNGETLRLLRNTVRFSKPSFIEFELKAIFEGKLYSEFVLFYRLVHVTRLPRGAGDAHECWLERYYQQGIEQGGRVRERLRDGVKEALEILGTGFFAHPESEGLREAFKNGRLSSLDYYRQLLRLIYRLLFLMVAEERRLLFVRDEESRPRQDIYDRWYSIERLRKRAENRFSDDGHSDLWEGLKQTFGLFEDAKHASQLGLTALDGELFGRLACADLIDREGQPGPRLRNGELLSALWRLSTFEDSDGRRRKGGVRRRVNFAGLDVEELGSVYESLLDYHPEVKIDGAQSKFELVAGSERKSTGSYYTPPELVRELIKSALEPVIEDRLKNAATREDKERALLSLKICDPASGSGHFLLAAARRLGRELARVRSGEAEPNPADHRHAIRDVIRRCIYAVDKNPLAVDLCKVALWIEGHEPGLPLSFLDHHVKCGDSLIGVFDLKVLEAGVPDDAYKPVTGDDKTVASTIRKRNKDEAKDANLFRRPVSEDVARIASAFAALADLPETMPEEVRAKEAAYVNLRRGDDWARAKWACDLWTAAFFAPLTKEDMAAVPTTRHVWEAVSGRLPQGRLAGLVTDLAARQPFFHWPLEFPEVFSAGGFDVMLGNPPWEVSQFSETEFFRVHAPQIGDLPAAKRTKAIEALEGQDASLWARYQHARHAVDAENKFFRRCGRYVLAAHGKLNTYALFSELFLRATSGAGRTGFIVPAGIATDYGNKEFFGHLVEYRRILSLIAFDNQKRIFPSVHPDTPFCLLTLGQGDGHFEMAFYLLELDHASDKRRRFTLTPEEIELINPNTRTCPIFRTVADAELTKKIFRRLPILIREEQDRESGEFDLQIILNFFSTSDAETVRLFRPYSEAKDDPDLMPVLRGSAIYQFDHRHASYDSARDDFVPCDSHWKDEENDFPLVDKYVSTKEVHDRLRQKGWTREWLMGWRDVTNATNERTVIATVFPVAATDDTLSLILPRVQDTRLAALLLGALNSIPLDYVAHQKVGGTHIRKNIIAQFPVPSLSTVHERDITFVSTRVGELVYTSRALAPFSRELGYDAPPFKWDPDRRALLRAELDAYYAYLYGLTRRELEYILDPKAVMGEDYPSETFRVLKENEIKEFGEYRTQRLVLEAWDRFAADGTFDPARLREPQYIDRIADELSATRRKLQETEQNSKALLALASASPKPTLFVEGATDAKIIEAAWGAFFPTEPMPVKVIAAGGTKEMGSLAGKGKALREILGEQLVLVLADNDSAGRSLVEDGHVKKGGIWRQLPNGIHWCLLKPTDGFSAAMNAHAVPAVCWPFTIEAAFSPALRRQALAAGVYQFSGELQAEIFENPDVARRLVSAVPKLGPDDDAYWYLMAPHHEAKDSFAAWVTAPERRTEENFAAFEEIIRGLRALLAPAQDQPRNKLSRGAA